MAEESKKYVLVVCSFANGRADAISKAMRCAHRIRAGGHVPIARCLDWDLQHDDPASIREMREFEIAAIRRKFVDAVEFVDAEQPDVADVVAWARQYHYPVELAKGARSAR